MDRICHRRIAREYLLAMLLCLLAGHAPALIPGKTAHPVLDEASADLVLPLVWLDNIETAVNMAGMEYRPVMVLFSSPDCGWCRRLKAQIDADKHVFVPAGYTDLSDDHSYQFEITYDRNRIRPGWGTQYKDFEYDILGMGESRQNSESEVALHAKRLFKEGY